MTREEAIRILYVYRAVYLVDANHREAFDMAIKALEQEPKLLQSLEQEKEAYNALVKNIHCEDAISRQAALDKEVYTETNDGWTGWTVDVNDIKELQPVTPQPKTGHWIIKDGKEQGYDIGGVKTWYIQIMCSECGFIKAAIEGHTGQYHYCPNCGAKMEVDE